MILIPAGVMHPNHWDHVRELAGNEAAATELLHIFWVYSHRSLQHQGNNVLTRKGTWEFMFKIVSVHAEIFWFSHDSLVPHLSVNPQMSKMAGIDSPIEARAAPGARNGGPQGLSENRGHGGKRIHEPSPKSP